MNPTDDIIQAPLETVNPSRRTAEEQIAALEGSLLSRIPYGEFNPGITRWTVRIPSDAIRGKVYTVEHPRFSTFWSCSCQRWLKHGNCPHIPRARRMYSRVCDVMEAGFTRSDEPIGGLRRL